MKTDAATESGNKQREILPASPSPNLQWPIGGGECGRHIRERDWAETDLGPIDSWSPALRTTISNIVNSPIPKVLTWGPKHVMLYNDAYIEIVGGYHPAAFGKPAEQAWPEMWTFNRDVLEKAHRGQAVAFRDHPFVVARHDTPEQVTFDLFYTPIRAAEGTVDGVMCTVLETTQRIAAEKALKESEYQLRTVTDALPILISFIDRDQIYRFVNRYYEEWFGLDRKDIINRPIREVIGEEYYQSRRLEIERALTGEPIIRETSSLPQGRPTDGGDELFAPHRGGWFGSGFLCFQRGHARACRSSQGARTQQPALSGRHRSRARHLVGDGCASQHGA